MKTRNPIRRRGFTLMELMVAMAITTIIVTVLVSITSIALDTWNRSRSELRAARMGKMMMDFMEQDLEALVVRRGNSTEWLSARIDLDLSKIGTASLKSTNAARLIFFTAATDRYNGNVGISTLDKGGDVSCAAYMLDYMAAQEKTFILSRLLVDPDETFSGGKKTTPLLGVATESKPLEGVFTAAGYQSKDITDARNRACENVYQFSVAFHVQVTDTSVAPAATKTVRVAIGPNGAESFRILGSGIITDYSGPDKDLVPSGRVVAVEIFATVLSDFGLQQIQPGRRTFPDDKTKAEFLAKNSYSFSKLVRLPSM